MAVAAEQVAQLQPETASESGAKASSKLPTVDEYVGELLSRIQPAPASEHRRKTVAQYVEDVIARAFQPGFEVKAFTYGSVPLKTYLPDGDIDLAIFQNKGAPQQLKDNWFLHLSSYLQREEYSPAARYRIRDVQVIHAEVKLVKCLVDNIVVDISFQSLGGLCTVNFLESIDRRIDDHHLFKRSIILVKAWCYYESRLLGAHHGLISTYALETMVLYIFMVYHKTVTTPLKVLHKFLSVFSKFDWDNLCLSLQGPIPLSTFPDPKPLPFPESDGAPLLREDFMADMRHMYSPPGMSSTTPRSFQLKSLNIMDPLLPTNNLGRSVNKSNFVRIRRALEYGAKRLTAILDMEATEAIDTAKAFFRNTWNAQRSQVQQLKQKSPPSRPLAHGVKGGPLPEPSQHRPMSAAPKGPPSLPSNSKAMHPLQSQPVSNGWTMQAVPVPQGLQMPNPVTVMQLQQLMVQISQHNLHNQSMYPSYLGVPMGGELSATRRVNGSNSLPMADQQPIESQASRAQSLQMQRQDSMQLQSRDAVEARRLSHSGESEFSSHPSSSQNGGSLPKQMQSDSSQLQKLNQARKHGAGAHSSMAGGPVQTAKPSVKSGTLTPQESNGMHVEDGKSNGNGNAWRDGMSQPNIVNGLVPQNPGYSPVMQGNLRLVPVMAPLQLPNGRLSDYYPLSYPTILPNGSLPGGFRGPAQGSLPPGFLQLGPGSGHTAHITHAPQRHSDPGTMSTADMLDATLSGDLERLSQHLQSARAMYDSNTGPSSRSSEQSFGRYGENGYRQYGGYPQGQYPRGPTRSSSAGNLNHLRSIQSYPNTARRPSRPDGSPNGPVDNHPHPSNHFYPANGYGLRPRFQGRQQAGDYHHVPRAPYDHYTETSTAPPSERGHSRPPSPLRANGHSPAINGPMSGHMAVGEWPGLPGLKNQGPAEWQQFGENGRPGWSTASEGRPGWASPVGSTVSEQSLSFLKGLRTNGTSPSPMSPSIHLPSPHYGGNHEGQHPLGEPPQDNAHFVLAEEDFPVLPSHNGTPLKAGPKTSWLPEGKKVHSTS